MPLAFALIRVSFIVTANAIGRYVCNLTVMSDIALALSKTYLILDCVLSQFLTIGLNADVRESLGFVAFAFAREKGRKAESA